MKDTSKPGVEPSENASRYMIEAVEKSLRILLSLADHPTIGVAEAASIAGVSRSRAYRILTTLESAGLAARMPRHGYRTGAKAVRFATLVLAQLDVRAVSRPTLERLWRETGESVNLAILRGLDLVCTEVLESPSQLRVADTPGTRWPLHATATGRAISAHLDRRLLDAAVGPEPFQAYTQRTATTWTALDARLADARERGYAIDIEESAAGVACVAAALFRDGTVIGGISVTGPRSRLTDGVLEAMAPRVVHAAADISAALGVGDSTGGRSEDRDSLAELETPGYRG